MQSNDEEKKQQGFAMFPELNVSELWNSGSSQPMSSRYENNEVNEELSRPLNEQEIALVKESSLHARQRMKREAQASEQEAVLVQESSPHARQRKKQETQAAAQAESKHASDDEYPTNYPTRDSESDTEEREVRGVVREYDILGVADADDEVDNVSDTEASKSAFVSQQTSVRQDSTSRNNATYEEELNGHGESQKRKKNKAVTNKTKIREWAVTRKHLRQREVATQKDVSRVLMKQQQQAKSEGRRKDEDILGELGKLQEKYRRRRAKEFNGCRAEIREVKALVRQFKDHVQGVNTDNDAYVQGMRRLMEGVEDKLTGFKSEQREKYIELETEASGIEKEVQTAMNRFNAWEAKQDTDFRRDSRRGASAHDRAGSAPSTASRSAKAKVEAKVSTRLYSQRRASSSAAVGTGSSSSSSSFSSASSSSSSSSSASASSSSSTSSSSSSSSGSSFHSPELEEVMKWIDRHGGVTGGWDSRDHADFLKLKAKTPNTITLLQRGGAEIPNQTPQTVAEHLNWYNEFLEQNKRKKALIRTWKSEKQSRMDEELALKLKEENQKERRQRRRASTVGAEERKQQAEAVRKWKEARQAEKEQVDEERARKIREKESKKAAAAAEQRQKLKARVQQYHREQEIERRQKELRDAASEEVTTSTAEAKETKRRLREKREEEIRKAREKARRAEDEKAAKDRRLALLIADSRPDEVKVEKSRQRLVQETDLQKRRREDAEQRKKEIQNGHKFDSKTGIHVRPLYMPTRKAMSTWSRG